MEMQDAPSDFEHLPLAKTAISATLEGAYRVYTDPTNYTVIKASCALEALETSGMESAFKIEREALFSTKLLRPQFGKKAEASAENAEVPKEAAASEEGAPASEGEPAAPEAASGQEIPKEETLSGDDVEKLLEGEDKPTEQE